MTQARRAQRRILAKEIVSPTKAEGFVDWELNRKGDRKFFCG